MSATGALRWHTDRTDVVALLCVDQARAGGLSEVASALAIHNAMLACRPDLLDELYADMTRGFAISTLPVARCFTGWLPPW